MTKTQVPLRAPDYVLKKIDEDAVRLRRSRSSILLEIVEKHYDLIPPSLTKPTNNRKKAGVR
jgi:hypothetical protein